MYNGTFIGVSSGVSQKSGKDWYRLELIAETVKGTQKIQTEFCSENAYRNALSLEPMSKVRVAVGVSETGHFLINAIKKGE